MKGKKFLALASIFAGVAMVGTTFALWAVTDNADPFNVKISPGSIESDTSTKRVTLSYGDRVYTNVGEIVNGTKRLAATVELKAEWDVDTTYASFTGQFSVELETANTAATKLIDYLNVYVESTAPTVADGVVTSATPGAVGSLPYSESTHKATFNVALNAPVAKVATKTVYVIVEYRSASAAVIDTLSTDSVTMTLDWNKAGSDVVNSYTIYYAGSVTDPRVYAWNQTNTKINGSWPGVKMTQVRSGLYSYELDTAYYGFVIANGANEEKITGTDDVIVSTWKTTYYDHDNNCFISGTGWTGVPAETKYYVVGSFNMSGKDWVLADERYVMTEGQTTGETPETIYTLSGIELAKDTELKVYTNAGTGAWYGDTDVSTWDDVKDNITVGEDNNVVIKAQGTYDIVFYPSGTGGNYVGVYTHSS